MKEMSDIYGRELPYLAHHGVLGQKWGIRRYQNPDGTLTSKGKQHYNTEGKLSNVGRAVFNGSLGQRLATNLNRGYRQEKKEIKAKSKAIKQQIKSSNKSKEQKKAALKSLKSDTKKTYGEARVGTAEAIYPWQTTRANTKIQTQSIGKAFLKNALAGDYGSLTYDRLSTNKDANKLASAGLGYVGGFADYGTSGLLAVGDYAYNKHKSGKDKHYKVTV